MAKTLECEGSILSSSFCGHLANYYSHVFSLVHRLDEFSFKKMRTWGQSKVSSCCLCVWCKSRELGDRGSLNTIGGNLLHRPSTSYKKAFDRIAFGINYIILAKSRRARGASHEPAFMDSYSLIISHMRLACLPSRWVSRGRSIKSYWTESHMEFFQTSTTELLCESMGSVFR